MCVYKVFIHPFIRWRYALNQIIGQTLGIQNEIEHLCLQEFTGQSEKTEKETGIGHTENHYGGGLRCFLFSLSSSQSVEMHRGEMHGQQHVSSMSDKKWIGDWYQICHPEVPLITLQTKTELTPLASGIIA